MQSHARGAMGSSGVCPVLSRGCRAGLRRLSAALALVVALLVPAGAEAQNRTWDVTSGLWSDTGSWQGGVLPLTTGTAVFSGPTVGTTAATVLLGAPVEIRQLIFNSSGGATLQSDSTDEQLLTLGTGGISMAATAGPVTIGASGSAVNLLLGGTQTWTNNSMTSQLTVLGLIDTPTGTNALLTVAGVGTT